MAQKLVSETRARTLMIGDAELDGGVLKGGARPPLCTSKIFAKMAKNRHILRQKVHIFIIFYYFSYLHYFSQFHIFHIVIIFQNFIIFQSFSLFYTISLFFSIFYNGEWWREWKQIVAMFCKQCHSNGKSSHMRKNS